MSDNLNGKASVSVTSDDSQVYLVVASVPEMFTTHQHYPYKVRISEGETTAPPCENIWKDKKCKRRAKKCKKNKKVRANCMKTCDLCE